MGSSEPVLGPGVWSASSLLFVPGDRPDRFAKASAAGAGGVILDLEDAVGGPAKAAARAHVSTWLETKSAVVRVNDATTTDLELDLAMLRGRRVTVMLAKTESAAQVQRVTAALAPGSAVIALIETAAGVLASAQICSAPGVVRAAVGAVDLSTELGLSSTASPTLEWARAMVVLGSSAAGLAPPLDSPSVQIDDEAAIVAECRAAVALGFGGKLCIHPAQVPTVRRTFGADPDDVAWARTVLQAEADGGAVQMDGQMLDRPIFERARRILARAEARLPGDSSREENAQ